MENKMLYQLTQAIQLVASECTEQILIFPSFVYVPDEIAQLLNDSLVNFERSEQVNSLDSGILEKMKLLDKHFESLEKDKFTVEALCNSQDWNIARDKAKDILRMLHLEEKKPDLNWIRFVRE